MQNSNLLAWVFAGSAFAFGSCSSGLQYANNLDAPDGRLTNYPKARYVTGQRHGIAPTSGSDTLLIEGGGVDNAMGELDFDASIVAGTYVVSVDVGNPSDLILAEGTRVRLTARPYGAARGTVLEPVRYWRDDPVRGGIERWSFKFKVPRNSQHIGKQVGVAIWVPGMGKARNISFDNVQVQSFPNSLTGIFDTSF